RVVEAREQLDERGLAGAVRADDGERAAGGDLEIERREHRLLLARVDEADALEADGAARQPVGGAGAADDAGRGAGPAPDGLERAEHERGVGDPAGAVVEEREDSGGQDRADERDRAAERQRAGGGLARERREDEPLGARDEEVDAERGQPALAALAPDAAHDP